MRRSPSARAAANTVEGPQQPRDLPAYTDFAAIGWRRYPVRWGITQTCYHVNRAMAPPRQICDTYGMESQLVPSQRVKAIWLLWSQDNPITLLYDYRYEGDMEPYVVACGTDIEAAILMRLTEIEANWLIKRRGEG